MDVPRKPPRRVLSIRGESRLDVVTDVDYHKAVEAQDAVLFAQGVERKILGRLRTQLSNGASDRGRKYYFDPERGIVRRRESRPGRKKAGTG